MRSDGKSFRLAFSNIIYYARASAWIPKKKYTANFFTLSFYYQNLPDWNYFWRASLCVVQGLCTHTYTIFKKLTFRSYKSRTVSTRIVNFNGFDWKIDFFFVYKTQSARKSHCGKLYVSFFCFVYIEAVRTLN